MVIKFFGRARWEQATVPIITLLSDFGLKDPCVGEMKAVILSIYPQAQIVDISHNVEKFDIRMGAFVLASAAPYFPTGTVHAAVVDPGVGTKRRPIIVQTERSLYVGPDNGLLMLSAQREGIRHARHIVNQRYMLPQISKTFHGRDIFAPVAAHLAMGSPLSEFGQEIQDYVLPEFTKPRTRKGELLGEVLHIDNFGNVISNISVENLKKMGIREGCSIRIKLDDKRLTLKFCSAYGEVAAQTPLVIIGSSDFLELSVNQGSASRMLRAKIGNTLRVSLAFSG